MDIVFPVAVLVLLLVLLWELGRVVEGNAQIHSLLDTAIHRQEMESILAVRDAASFRERIPSDRNRRERLCARCRISLRVLDEIWIDPRAEGWFFCSESCLAALQGEWREAELTQVVTAATQRKIGIWSEEEISDASIPWWQEGENPPPPAC